MPHNNLRLPADLRCCLKRLKSYRKKRREEALATARQLSSDQLIALIAAANQHIRRIHRHDSIFYLPIWIIFGMPTVAMLLTFLHRFFHFDLNTATGVVMMSAIGIPSAALLYSYVTNPMHRYKVLGDVIAEREDACLLGPALDMHQWNNSTLTSRGDSPRDHLLPTIERIVRQMATGDYADLTAQQKHILLQWLKPPFGHLSLSLALLDGLKTVGDKSAMKKVAKLTTLAEEEVLTPRQKRFRAATQLFLPNDISVSLTLMEKLTPPSEKIALEKARKLAEREEKIQKEKQVQEAARLCLTEMQRIHSQEQQAQVLLRASDANRCPASNILLRPASGTPVLSAPNQLLRASDADAQR